MQTTDEREFTREMQRILPDTTLADVQEIKANAIARQRLKVEQDTLFFKVASLLYKFDVEGVVFDEREHELEPEAAEIIPLLPKCKNTQDCARMIQQVFAKWFGGRVRSLEHYQELGAAVFEAWQSQQLNKSGNFSN